MDSTAAPAAPATPAAFYKMISIPEAQETVLEHTRVLPAEALPLGGILGRVLAEDVTASEPLPPFPASIKDGYAVVAADGPGEYEVAFEVLAGAEQQTLQAGKIAYIGTGGPLPHGADAVVQIEDTAVVGRSSNGAPLVTIKLAARPGQDIRAVGSDIKAGEAVLAAGERVGPAEIGLLATVGAATVKVHAAPHVAILSTGDELAEPAASHLPAGAIRDANRPMLLAAAADAGASTLDLGIVSDSAGLAGLEATLHTALDGGADVLITSGGVSMGDKDLVKPLLERHAVVHFGRVRMKPGKPLTFATLDRPNGGKRLLVFGLPGNPVSSLVTFNLVVLPALRKLAGWKEPMLRRLHATLSAPLKLDPVRPEYHRAALRWAPPSPQKLPLAGSGSAAGAVTMGKPSGGSGPAPLLGTPAGGWPVWVEDGLSEVDLGNDGGSGRGSVGSGGGEFVAVSTGGQISSRLLSMRSAAALLELPQAEGELPAGSTVTALLIADLR